MRQKKHIKDGKRQSDRQKNILFHLYLFNRGEIILIKHRWKRNRERQSMIEREINVQIEEKQIDR